MESRIKIRGIFSTALTRLLLDCGYPIVDPSVKIRELFGLDCRDEPHDILIQDRENLQGILLSGQPEKICQFLTFLQERLTDAVLLDFDQSPNDESVARAVMEFPGASKKELDIIRGSVTPTLARHHLLRIVDSKALERAETSLARQPENQEILERKLFREAIVLPLEKNGIVRLEHVRPSGKSMRPREGVLTKLNSKGLVFKRFFSEGRYDGLDLPIQKGDYGLTTVEEGAWHIKHSYYDRNDRLIGEYYNVNTPVELYPYGARYLDLEVDVVRRTDGLPVLLDREKLALQVKSGCIGRMLETKAMDVANGILKQLNARCSVPA